MRGNMVDIQSPTAEIRRGKKEEETTGWKYIRPALLHRATINKVLWSVYTDIVGVISVRPASVVCRLVTEVPTTLHSVIQRLTVNTCEHSEQSREINSFGWYNDSLKIHQSQPNIYTLFWRFDLITRSLSEEAGTQFFRVLMRRSAVASRKRS